MNNLFIQCIVEASRMLTNTICNNEKCICNQFNKHGWGKQIYVKVLLFSK